MPTSCEIDFENNPMKMVFAGELLSGDVRLTLTKEKHIRSIYVQIKGRASIRLDDPTKGFNSGKQTYLNKAIYLVRESNDNIDLKPGKYNYQFQCMMPSDLPSTIEGLIGYLRYSICVVIDIPMRRNKEFELPFTVIKTIDLNDYPALRRPVIVSKNKQFLLKSLMCDSPSEMLCLFARIPVQGFIPNEVIHLELYIDNKTSRSITGFKMQLVKQIEYMRRKKEFLTISEYHARGCCANQKQLIYGNVVIPSICPADLSSMPNRIIEVKYLIRITGVVSGCFKNPVLSLPIFIGSLPFQNLRMTQASIFNSNDERFDFPDHSSNHSDDPPTYEEALVKINLWNLDSDKLRIMAYNLNNNVRKK